MGNKISKVSELLSNESPSPSSPEVIQTEQKRNLITSAPGRSLQQFTSSTLDLDPPTQEEQALYRAPGS